jgi:MoxR-like ATPase
VANEDDGGVGASPTGWYIYDTQQRPDGHTGVTPNRDQLKKLGEPPDWRRPPMKTLDDYKGSRKAIVYEPGDDELRSVNAALILRRPLLVTGDPGVGKTSLAYSVAYRLGLEPVLTWPVTSRTSVQDGLYHYDAIGRLQYDKNGAAASKRALELSLRLGPLGTAFFGRWDERMGRMLPRVLLIDELDKGDVDLPNDLLHVFEEQYFDIPEIARFSRLHKGESGSSTPAFEVPPHDAADPVRRLWDERDPILETVDPDGRVPCKAFPLIIMTSNGERDFPPAFRRRCLELEIKRPERDDLKKIVARHFQEERSDQAARARFDEISETVLNEFKRPAKSGQPLVGADQLLNACQIVLNGTKGESGELDTEAIRDLARICLNGGG